MKMGMKTTAIASVLALALMSGTAMAQTETGTSGHHPQQQTDGEKMKGKGQGMMNGNGMMMQGNMGCMKMMGQGMMKHMSADNQQKFMDATKEMRKEMHMMRFEHMDAMRDPNTSLDDLATMEQKMLDSRKDMMKKAKDFQDQKK